MTLAAAPPAAPKKGPKPPHPRPPQQQPVPQVWYTCSPAPADCSGWFRSDVTLRWNVTPAGAPNRGCATQRFTADTSGAVAICRAAWGRYEAVGRAIVRLDRTPPQVTAAVPARRPNDTGWFTKPIRVDFYGDDATSGIASCGSATYSGPDSAAAWILGRCQDQAGNKSGRAFSLRFDATPPLLSGLTATPQVGRVVLRWQSSPDVRWAEVVRSTGSGSEEEDEEDSKHSEHSDGATVVFRGSASSFTDDQVQNGVRYLYRVRVADAAGNEARELVSAVPIAPPQTGRSAPAPGPVRGRGRLLFPGPHATVSRRDPPLLRWVAVRRARYYNLQIFRGSRKVLSVWPRRPHYQLKRRWTYHGTTQRLHTGRYRWFVWPGFGPRPKARYGKLLGRRSFTVVSR